MFHRCSLIGLIKKKKKKQKTQWRHSLTPANLSKHENGLHSWVPCYSESWVNNFLMCSTPSSIQPATCWNHNCFTVLVFFPALRTVPCCASSPYKNILNESDFAKTAFAAENRKTWPSVPPFMVQSDNILTQLSSSLTPSYSAHLPHSTSFSLKLLHLHFVSPHSSPPTHLSLLSFVLLLHHSYNPQEYLMNCLPFSILPTLAFSLNPSA